MAIVLDDCQTAARYFEVLKREWKTRVTIHIERARKHGSRPKQLCEQAIEEMMRLRGGRKKSRSDRTSVWLLLDLERDPEREQEVAQIRERARKRDIAIACSQPCFEVWTPLHLTDTGQYFMSAADVLDELERLWKQQFGEPLGKKAQADYSRLRPFVDEAIKRARNHCRDPSYTEVYLVVETLRHAACSP